MNQQLAAAKQAMDFQKAAMDGMFGGFQLLWNHTEVVFKTFLSFNPWIPEQGRNAVSYWIDSSKKSLEYFKNLVNSGYSALETGYSGMQMMESTANVAKSATAPVKNVVDATPLKPVTDVLPGQQESQEQPAQN